MILYKNISFSAKTFYGIRFEPGEIKEVPGYITAQDMVRVFKAPAEKLVEKPTEKLIEQPAAPVAEDVATVTRVETRGRKKKSSEPEKGLVAENTENKIISEEETSNGN